MRSAQTSADLRQLRRTHEPLRDLTRRMDAVRRGVGVGGCDLPMIGKPSSDVPCPRDVIGGDGEGEHVQVTGSQPREHSSGDLVGSIGWQHNSNIGCAGCRRHSSGVRGDALRAGLRE
jgi:hypothetical protein